MSTEKLGPENSSAGHIDPESMSVAISRASWIKLTIGFGFLTVVLGMIQCWEKRYTLVDPDGLSYLDIANAYLRGDFNVAINAYWSPFYSWILAGGLFIAQPSKFWETEVIHGTHIVIAVISLIAFAYFLRELFAYRRATYANEDPAFVGIPDTGIAVIGFCVFLWTTIELVTIPFETADLALLPFVFLASGLLTRIRRNQGGWQNFALLGIVLGLAYLDRVAMFPLAFVFLASAALLMNNPQKAAFSAIIGLAFFALVAGPYIAAISLEKGRLTIGDAAKLNYAWTVGGVRAWVHWQGQKGVQAPHVPKRIFDSPPVYSFNSGKPVTYALWHDPSYWYEGLNVTLNLRGHFRAAVRGGVHYLRIFFYSHYSQNALMVIFLLFLLLAWRHSPISKLIAPYAIILLPSLAALFMYLVVHVETRYIAPFIAVIWVALFAAIKLPRDKHSEKLMNTACVAVAIVMLVKLFVPVVDSVDSIIKTVTSGQDRKQHTHWVVAQEMARAGIAPGDHVGVIGDAFRTYWGRLAGVELVAELPKRYSSAFWNANPETKSQVLAAFASTGAKAVVASESHECASFAGWIPLNNTNFCLLMLTP